jgi:hypothetical protein
VRKVLVAILILALAGTVAVVAAVRHGADGYLSPQFTPDGKGVVVVVREARALVLGFGYQMWTPPARVLVTRDRFRVVWVALADGRVETLHDLPASPVEGRWIQTYRPGVYGSASAHLRWATPEALEYEVGVTVPRQPTSDTYVTRRRGDDRTHTWIESAPWTPGYAGMGGDEASQLSGDREVVAVRAGGAMPCAVVIVTGDEPRARPVLEAPECRKAHPDGYDVAALSDVLRRADIERVANLNATHAGLVAEARARGLSEGDAALEAIRGMQRLGLYPKPSTIVATRVVQTPPGATVFTISDQEFVVGLFNDIREAIDRPGEEIEKAGTYIIHNDYDTSRQINQYLADRQDTEFFVHADGALWRLVVDYR